MREPPYGATQWILTWGPFLFYALRWLLPLLRNPPSLQASLVQREVGFAQQNSEGLFRHTIDSYIIQNDRQTIPPPITSAPPFAQGGLRLADGFADNSLCWGNLFRLCASLTARPVIMNEHRRPSEFFGKYIDLKPVLCYSI